jgi:hypothetical protein
MTSYINHPEDKFNVILSILLQHKIVVIVLKPPAACRRFSPFTGDRRLAAKPVIVSVILISALGATSDQPFSGSCGFDESERIILKVLLADVCLIDRGCVYD